MRDRITHTVDDYKKAIEVEVFNGSIKANVDDIYVVPDFTSFFEAHIDKHFSNYAKEEDTQHMFQFEAIKATTDFPLGCRTMYRAYSSDRVVEFVKKPKAQCLSPIGQLTGLEPYTLSVSWGPTRASTVSSDKEIVGFYILKSLPILQDDFRPKEFEKDSMSAFKRTVDEAKKRFTSGNNPEALTEWKQWEEDYVCPDDTKSTQYIIDKPYLFQIPLIQFFKSDYDQTDSPLWVNDLQTSLTIKDGSFQWPAQESTAQHSVRSEWNRDPMPSRVYKTLDSDLVILLNAYSLKCSDYYNKYLTNSTIFTNENLKDIIRQRLSDTGTSLALGGTKVTLIKLIQRTDRSFLTVLFKTLTTENVAFLSGLLHRPYRSLDEASIEQCKTLDSATQQNYILNLSQIRQFKTENKLDIDVIQFFVALSNNRNTHVLETHLHINGNSSDASNYVALKHNFYCTSTNTLNNLPVKSESYLNKCGKFFICFKRSSDISLDNWAIICIDFSKYTFYYIDPCLPLDTTVNGDLNVLLLTYKKKVSDWFQLCNFTPAKTFEIKLYDRNEHCIPQVTNGIDSGIYAMAIMDTLSHDCPRFIDSSHTYILRQNYCYSVMNNWLPY